MKYFIDFSIFSRNRNFTFLYIGQFVSFIGTMITGVALPYQIYTETHSTLMVGLLSLAQLFPLLFTALLGGVFADRYHRRLLLLITESILAIGCLLLAFNASLPFSYISIIFVVAIGMSAINGLHRPALDSIVQQIVPKKDLPVVSALATFKFSISMIVGPAIGGLFISHMGIVTTYLLDFVSFLISLIALLMMWHIPKPIANHDESTWVSIKQGFRYAFSRQELIGTYFVDFIAMVFGMPSALFPAIALAIGGPSVLGMLYSALAVGALFVSFFSGLVSHVKYHGRAVALAAMGWGIAIICFGLSSSLWWMLFFLALAGACDAISGMFRMVMWNETIPNQLRGRLSGIEMISYLSGPKLGDTEAGLVASLFGVTISIISGGILCVIGVMICSYCLPKFWQYRSKIEDPSS